MSNPKVALFYFSGTGNTKAVCEMLSEAIIKEQYDMETVSIENEKVNECVDNTDDVDYIGLAFPIYGLGAPRIITEFAEVLVSKIKAPKKFFILMTAGDYIGINHAATQSLIKAVENKGHQVVYERIIVMGVNFVISYKLSFNKQVYELAKLKTEHMAKELLSGKFRRLAPSKAVKLFAKFVHKGESKYGAVTFGKSLMTDASCNQCFLCVKECPVGNLSLSEKGVIGSNQCIMCMRCVYNCPNHSLYSKSMQFVILKDGYNLQTYIDSQDTDKAYVNEKTKGFYKHFFKYVDNIEI